MTSIDIDREFIDRATRCLADTGYDGRVNVSIPNWPPNSSGA